MADPTWFNKVPGTTEQSAENPLPEEDRVNFLDPEATAEKTDYVESDAERDLKVELRGILDEKKSKEMIDLPELSKPYPLSVLWGQLKRNFEKALNERGLTKNDLVRVNLYHLLYDSSPIPQLPIDKFDLPGGDIERFIRTGEFLSNGPMSLEDI
ncbi:MAG: hypothetical protein K9M11_00735 [Candidatus Pacebacteria bacterium]|nr:hypothetical protein [Candidatus Paceibacterota bacterium]